MTIIAVSEGGHTWVCLGKQCGKRNIDLPRFSLYLVFFHARYQQIVGVFDCTFGSEDGPHSILNQGFFSLRVKYCLNASAGRQNDVFECQQLLRDFLKLICLVFEFALVANWQIGLEVSIGDSFKRTRKHLLIHTVATLFGLFYHYQLIKCIVSFRIFDETSPFLLCGTFLQEKAEIVALLSIH